MLCIERVKSGSISNRISRVIFFKKNVIDRSKAKKKNFLLKIQTLLFIPRATDRLCELFPLEWIDSSPITVYTFCKEKEEATSFVTREFLKVV